jgi:hypothetical protein
MIDVACHCVSSTTNVDQCRKQMLYLQPILFPWCEALNNILFSPVKREDEMPGFARYSDTLTEKMELISF